MELVLLGVPVAMVLAWFNGANDNIKGAATLVGCGLRSERQAIVLATAATAAGGLASIWFVSGLIAVFSGQGIVPDALVGSAEFLIPVGLGAACTVGLATRLGLPVSTTHSLIGALLGVSVFGYGVQMHLIGSLVKLTMFQVAVPLLAILLALAVLPMTAALRRRAEAPASGCICISGGTSSNGGVDAIRRSQTVTGSSHMKDCEKCGQRALDRWPAPQSIDGAHVVSSLAVSFARGLNDTPKIAAIALVALGAGGVGPGTVIVVVAMAAGGLIAAMRVTRTMSWHVTRMDNAEGFGGNMVTSVLVLASSAISMPISTTHVSCGSLFGIAASNRTGNTRTIAAITLAWLLTMPLAAVIGIALFTLITMLPL